jgi:hypothetical protein
MPKACPKCEKREYLSFKGVKSVSGTAYSKTIRGAYCHEYECTQCGHEFAEEVLRERARDDQ